MTFKNASKSFQSLNPSLGLLPVEKSKLQGNVDGLRGRGIKVMTKPEAEYSLNLEMMKQRGEILRYEYEGITLRWNGVRYTPDFVVVISDDHHSNASAAGYVEPRKSYQFKLIEIKGVFTKGKYERAIERFRHARTYWPEFQFELHQKTKQGWKQIL